MNGEFWKKSQMYFSEIFTGRESFLQKGVKEKFGKKFQALLSLRSID